MARGEADWRGLFESAVPLLEWVAENGDHAGEARAEEARQLLVRHYLAISDGPSVAKAKPAP